MRGFPPYTPHGWKYLTVGRNGELFISVGPPCNERLPPSGTSQVRRIDPDNGNAELWAIGVRNSVGGAVDAVDPRTGNLWFTENARDWLGDDIPRDKLSLVSNTGQDYGYPCCHQGDILDPVLVFRPDRVPRLRSPRIATRW